MLYPPNLSALPDTAFSYPHYCSNPRPRFSGAPQSREPPSPRRQPTSPQNCSAHASSTRRGSQPEQFKSNFGDYVLASLRGFGMVYGNFSIPVSVYGTEPTASWSSAAHAPTRERGSRPTPEPPATRFQELIGEVQKAKGGKRQKVKKCGRRLGNWVSNLCPQGSKKQKEGHLTQLLGGEQEGGAPRRESKVLGRRVSASSDVTLVEALEQHATVCPPTPPCSRHHIIYTGH